MSLDVSISSGRGADEIKLIPAQAAARQAIRAMAAEVAAGLDRRRPPSRGDLRDRGEIVLRRLGLPRPHLGFAMVAVSNEFWRPILEAIPFRRRLFLLPHCLRNRAACAGAYDAVGLHCAHCGQCEIDSLKREAERLGYSVIVAEGTSSVLLRVLEGQSDAIFGVACLDSLEKSFERVVELGVPHMAVPLLRDGCRNTEAEIDQIRAMLTAVAAAPSTAAPRSYIPLLREAAGMFQPPLLDELLAPYLEGEASRRTGGEGTPAAEAIALDWLREGGKRLRPFVTLASYAVARHGLAVLDGGRQLAECLPPAVRRLALAIEALHKASLAHDDIEDDDSLRYGRPTLHRLYGVGPAVNVGDYLIGLGYRLVVGEAGSLGPACTGDILARLASAHLELCRGQGDELRLGEACPVAEVMKIAAQKTAPAFEAALYAGLRAAGAEVDAEVLRRFATYLGEGFQVKNDLDDWQDQGVPFKSDLDDRQEAGSGQRQRGCDALAGRPTMLRAFAMARGAGPLLAEVVQRRAALSPSQLADQIHDIYCRSGAMDEVQRLYDKLRERALLAAAEFPTADLCELMLFLVRVVL